MTVGDKCKELCKWKKEQYVRDLDKLKEAVGQPRYVCEKCGRAAEKKKWLCKPVPLD